MCCSYMQTNLNQLLCADVCSMMVGKLGPKHVAVVTLITICEHSFIRIVTTPCLPFLVLCLNISLVPSRFTTCVSAVHILIFFTTPLSPFPPNDCTVPGS